MFNDEELDQIHKEMLMKKKNDCDKMEAKKISEETAEERKKQAYNLAYQGLIEFLKLAKTVALEPIDHEFAFRKGYKHKKGWIFKKVKKSAWKVFRWYAEEYAVECYIDIDGHYYENNPIESYEVTAAQLAKRLCGYYTLINDPDKMRNVFASALRGDPQTLKHNYTT